MDKTIDELRKDYHDLEEECRSIVQALNEKKAQKDKARLALFKKENDVAVGQHYTNGRVVAKVVDIACCGSVDVTLKRVSGEPFRKQRVFEMAFKYGWKRATE